MVVNPRGGMQRGIDVLEQVKPLFAAADISLDVHVSQYAGHAGELARNLDLGNHDAFCLIGGDGTVHEVVNGYLSRAEPATVPLGLLPGGTGNTLHQEFGCEDPLVAARRIIEGNRLPIDVVRVALSDRTVYCVNIIGWGAVTDINRTAERLRGFGRYRYTLAALSHVVCGGCRSARLICDNEPLEGNYFFVMACNTKHTGADETGAESEYQRRQAGRRYSASVLAMAATQAIRPRVRRVPPQPAVYRVPPGAFLGPFVRRQRTAQPGWRTEGTRAVRRRSNPGALHVLA